MGAIGFAIAPGRWRVGGSAAAPAVFDFTAGALPAGATLSRASAATRIDAGGALASAPSDVARFDHDPATLALRGLLIEPAATNKLWHSAALDTAPWYPAASMAVAANAATAPDGTLSADRLTMTGSGIARHSQNYAPAGQDMLSIWLRGSVGGEAISFTAANNMSGLIGPSQTVVLTTGWVRYSFAPAPATNEYLLLGRNEAIAGNASSSATVELFAWGAQAEAGAKATSLIPTAAATATRSADVLTLDWASQGVGDGAVTVRYTFDDLSTQDVATTIAGGTATVPTTLNRPRLRKAERVV